MAGRAGRKTRRKKRTQAIAKRYACHANAKMSKAYLKIYISPIISLVFPCSWSFFLKPNV